ncbi:hypothetical protein CO112_03270 [Candidatus Dojkabacteria bacterium CG_4_9_14_3_um_filter_150_Dojkabacteria_WS6_41_13]|uniref:Uncharacterized protein n=1 Tax=Candidatus Dojkabacteria bacterium CG_4_10_14_0_2_um_filter_Dojkabacteria_WS6_41_15 TaxID=2014249 RepID=A0A2M7W0Q6_9BACT|nr:MAG: hypothetical protein COZ14_00265 [Candidatus Dojkabacteria bacterium CG_4_10_14_3_um_filter_Dojkabacteria_WS6_41_9]PJA12266.1 MAG: hypothetical protein COX64_04840 [Candidatus Dojkabacteria bacterium CG_4_10_14_0_2_um_filter_Dojkabacteria_WS6_41_15]PJB22638.1 MAG: hypothetical protein CO112_03270 [Candidatus Dojkabacteria bacterium CG_4_9_14_3_um_filter_150_Dojkabacteria_WS6_41_13]
MPIITTLGQDDTTTPIQPTSGTLHPRLQSAFTPTQVQPVSAPVAKAIPNDDLEDDDFTMDDDFGDDSEDVSTATAPVSPAKPGLSLSRMSEEQRRKVISTAFTLVLGKDPSDRDFSYYRFSTLTEESLIKSLLNLPEHKKLVEKAQEHTSLKQSVQELDMQVKQLSAGMQSMKQELVTMQDLLVEKNRYIQQMRGIPNNSTQRAYPSTAPSTNESQLSEQSNQAPAVQQHVVESKPLPIPSIADEMKNMFSGFFKKK